MMRRTSGLQNGVARVARVWSIVSASLLLATAGWSQTLTLLGTLPGGIWSYAYGVSADGSVVVGMASNAARESRAFRWTQAMGMQDLGTLGGGSSEAWGVSADGSVVVGMSVDAATYPRAFRWTQATGMQNLGTQDDYGSYAYGVSADGSVVVGASNSRAFRWQNGVMQDLGTDEASNAYGVSADGSVVVGWKSVNTRRRAFRWQNGVMQNLGTLPGDDSSVAYGVSADGSVVVGASNDRAFRWQNGVMQDLGTLPGGEWSIAYGVSADGSVVVGMARAAGQRRAFRWTAAGGMEDLNITYASLLTPELRLYSAQGISPNGRYIVGYAINNQANRFEAYLLDTVPEPASLMALGAGLAGLIRLRRRKQ